MIDLNRLRRALAAGGLNAAGLARALGVSTPTVMRALRRLRDAGEPVEAIKGTRGWEYRIGAAAGRSRGVPAFPRRPRDAHKGSVGRVLIAAGSRGMAGAAALACRAAYRAGAGLVYLAVPRAAADALAGALVETVLLPCGPDAFRPRDEARLRPTLGRCRAAAIGPGLSQRPPALAFASRILSSVRLPLVVDADGLAAVSAPRRAGPTLLTPHEGEMAALLGRTREAVASDREGAAREAARRFASIVILKGRRSVVTDGRRLELNRTGNPGLATAGTGDVLTGILVALLGQGFDPWAAARLGAHLHGRAGDLAAARVGPISMIASDVIDALPVAVQEQSRR
jgi:hydroxyethylthiazole kinase-like uncharacterized protein yjeF